MVESSLLFSDTERLFEGFENLMPFRVQDILLVSSLYDSFILREDGRLNELLIGQSLELHLHHTPEITHVSTAAEAIELAKAQPRFNLIVANIQLGDMDCLGLAEAVRHGRTGYSDRRACLRSAGGPDPAGAWTSAGYRAGVFVAGQSTAVAGHRQIRGGPAQRGARHAQDGRAGGAGGGRRRALLLRAAAGDLHGADLAISAGDE